MKRFLFIPLLILLTAVTGCEVTPENYQAEPNIYSLLSSDSSSVLVMVGTSVALGDTILVDTIVDTFIWIDPDNVEDTLIDTFTTYYFPWNGVSDAVVTLKQGSYRYDLTEHADSVGYYYLESVSFSPGQIWELEVGIPGRDWITAQTIFPDSFEILSPTERLVDESDILEWTQPAGVKGYKLGILLWLTEWGEDTTYIDSIAYSWWDLFPADSTRVPIMDLVDRLFYRPQMIDSFTVSISALDTNIYDYVTYHRELYFNPFSQEDSIRMEDMMHIEGALGAFGSKTVIRTQVHQFDTAP